MIREHLRRFNAILPRWANNKELPIYPNEVRPFKTNDDSRISSYIEPIKYRKPGRTMNSTQVHRENGLRKRRKCASEHKGTLPQASWLGRHGAPNKQFSAEFNSLSSGHRLIAPDMLMKAVMSLVRVWTIEIPVGMWDHGVFRNSLGSLKGFHRVHELNKCSSRWGPLVCYRYLDCVCVLGEVLWFFSRTGRFWLCGVFRSCTSSFRWVE